MTAIRDELNRLLCIHFGELWVPTETALQELEHFGDDLIPGLIECLNDADEDIRRLAVTLLGETRPRSNTAVPQLIELLNDPDLLVRVAVLTDIADFGPLAVGAILHAEQWLDSDNEYLKVLAATATVLLDPDRTELLPDIHAAMKNDDPSVRGVVREFFAKTKASLPFDQDAFQEVVRMHWHYNALSEQVTWRSMLDEEGIWRCEITAVMQEIYSGEDDGKRVWSGFDFHLSGFFHAPGVEVLDFGAASRCNDDAPIPFVGIKGRYFGEPFVLKIGLEPLPDANISEVVDTVRKVVRKVVRPITTAEDADTEATE